MSFRFYTNAISQATHKAAAGVLVVGLLLIGFGILILALPELFAILAALIFFIAGVGCGITAIKIFLVQRKLNQINSNDLPRPSEGRGSQGYRENVRVHIEEHYDV